MRFANHAVHVLGRVEHHKMWAKEITECVERHVGLAGPADAAQPVLLLRESLYPTLGRRNDQHTPQIQPLVSSGQVGCARDSAGS